MHKRHVLIIRRDDHKHDAVGAIFLDVLTGEGEIRACLERYLGPVFRVAEFERHGPVVRAAVECSRFETEAQNLVRLARALARKGRPRAAADTFAEALRLDPLNVDALKGEASLRMQRGDVDAAQDHWVRAAEIGGYDGETLRGLASIALAQDRRPTAMRYLEEAVRVNPDDETSRELLGDLTKQVEMRFEKKD